jgi:diketogulonate reductase-like aldo/keto reductase
MTVKIPSKQLNDGNYIPIIGLGAYGLVGEEGIASLLGALESGYRLIDTALNYQNEFEVGESFRRSGLPRDELCVTTKLPGRHHGYEETLSSFEESRRNLGLEYLDIYLIHWPMPRINKFADSWRAMIRLREEGLVRSIGVSNFTQDHINRLIEETNVVPAVNQIEMHPQFPQRVMRELNEAHGIVTESWSPLTRRGPTIDDLKVNLVARAHDVTPAQAILRWHLQLDAIPIPKSGDIIRQRENLDVFSFTLTAEEIISISSLESGRLWGSDPEIVEEL